MAKAKVVMPPDLGLTSERAREVFKKYFGDKHEILNAPKIRFYVKKRAFIVKKSAWVGALVWLEQKKGKTYFVLDGKPASIARWAIFFPLGVCAYVPFFYALSFGRTVEVVVGSFIMANIIVFLLTYIESLPSKKLLKEAKAFLENTDKFRETLSQI